ncbi:unnamed protein product [Phyllotreta striolata]|uniref:Gustatory receptor n=1 Tax=Phyllotreta striolata TaxID=444603 RepID=A0A9N9TUH2_PHYSR|nr:unnamed protein product [Phyllotreta striolata]
MPSIVMFYENLAEKFVKNRLKFTVYASVLLGNFPYCCRKSNELDRKSKILVSLLKYLWGFYFLVLTVLVLQRLQSYSTDSFSIFQSLAFVRESFYLHYVFMSLKSLFHGKRKQSLVRLLGKIHRYSKKTSATTSIRFNGFDVVFAILYIVLMVTYIYQFGFVMSPSTPTLQTFSLVHLFKYNLEVVLLYTFLRQFGNFYADIGRALDKLFDEQKRNIFVCSRNPGYLNDYLTGSQIRNLGKRILSLYELMEDFNVLYGSRLLNLFATVILIILTKIDAIASFIELTIIITFVNIALSLIFTSDAIITEGQDIFNAAYWFYLQSPDPSLQKEELRRFIFKMKYLTPVISAADFFTIKKSTLTALCSGLTTHSIVMIQLGYSKFNKHVTH